jgi:hypothetical protein
LSQTDKHGLLGQELLDTAKVAREFKHLVTVHRLSKSALGLDASNTYLNSLIYEPEPWHQCPEKAKKAYERMNELLKLNLEELQSFVTFFSAKRRLFSPLNSSFVYTPERFVAPLDTAIIAKRVLEVLRSNGITVQKLAMQFLGSSSRHLSSYLNGPRPWSECSEFQKGVFKCLHEWSQSPEQIEMVKHL